MKRIPTITPGPPVLDAETFQRLLAAAHILQERNDRRQIVKMGSLGLSDGAIARRPSVQPIGAGHINPFKAGAIVQKRTPSVLLRKPQLQAVQPDAVPFRSPSNSDKFSVRTDQPRVPALPEMAPVITEVFIAKEIAKEHLPPGRPVPPVKPKVPRRMNILLKGPIYWRMVEALAIATVFCMMVGVSIHRLSAFPGRASLPSEQRSASQPATPTAKVLASSQQPVGTRNSRQSPEGGEADIVAEDFVIRYRNLAVNLPGQAAKEPTSGLAKNRLLPPKNMTSKPGVRLAVGRDADMVAARVVQYGADVTMWSGNPKRARLDRFGH